MKGEDIDRLTEIGKVYRRIYNDTVTLYFDSLLKNNSREEFSKNMNFGYYYLREKYPEISSDNISQVIQLVRGEFTKLKCQEILNGEREKPVSSKIRIICHNRNVRFEAIGSKKAEFYLILTIYSAIIKERRIKIKVDFGIKDNRGKVVERLLSGEAKAYAQLNYTKKSWEAELITEENIPEPEVNFQGSLGIDIGVHRFIQMARNDAKVYTENTEIDDNLSLAYLGNDILEKNKSISIQRSKIDSCLKTSTLKGHGRKALLRKKEKLSEKYQNYKREKNIYLARLIVERAKKERRIIVIEDLKGLNKGSFIRYWQYAELFKWIENKAIEAGIPVIKVNPKYTSLKCSKCGYIPVSEEEKEKARPNRGELFICQSCGYKANADYNAAKNIAQLGWEKYIGE